MKENDTLSFSLVSVVAYHGENICLTLKCTALASRKPFIAPNINVESEKVPYDRAS